MKATHNGLVERARPQRFSKNRAKIKFESYSQQLAELERQRQGFQRTEQKSNLKATHNRRVEDISVAPVFKEPSKNKI
ncbi:MAG: hypothetical protein NZM65_10215 [Flavobacteriales bacterium]|nr:hypothetical protein [Flavobacteriales bacterium]MDW8411047.1 hypothetical protein [Flavobacteriales bacterium]